MLRREASGTQAHARVKAQYARQKRYAQDFTVVGSYPQPEWLVDRAMLGTMVPRVRVPEIWRVPAPFLEQAQDDATLLAIRDMERAGIDIITDGEMRRESYSNRFATALDGIDLDHPATITDRAASRAGCRASRGGSGAATRSRCATSSSCAPTPSGRSRSPCPAPSRCRARPRTSSTPTTRKS